MAVIRKSKKVGKACNRSKKMQKIQGGGAEPHIKPKKWYHFGKKPKTQKMGPTPNSVVGAKQNLEKRQRSQTNTNANIASVVEFMTKKSKTTGRQHINFFNNSGTIKAGIPADIAQYYSKLSPIGRAEAIIKAKAITKAKKQALFNHLVENRSRINRFNNNGRLMSNSKGLQSLYFKIYQSLTPEERKEVVNSAAYNTRGRPAPRVRPRIEHGNATLAKTIINAHSKATNAARAVKGEQVFVGENPYSISTKARATRSAEMERVAEKIALEGYNTSSSSRPTNFEEESIEE